MVESVQNFFQTGYLLKEWNRTLLILIPKVVNPEMVSQLRPISLCNTIFKCATRWLVDRLKLVLPSLISDSQHAFVPGRYMCDNIILSQDLLEKINRRTKCGPCLAALN